MSSARVTLAAVGAPHGVRGEVRVKCFLADPMALGAYGPLSANGRTLTVESVRPLKGDLVVARFREIATREAAEALRGLELTVPRSALPEPEEGEVYHADLVGLRAETVAGETLGRVRAIYDFGAGDVLEIEGPGGVRLLPFTKAAVPVIDLAGGRIVVDPPAETEAREG
jgi:16S rRNA processing protein RimM